MVLKLNKLINAVVRNVFFQLSRVKPLIFCLWQEIKEIFAMHFMLVLIQATTFMLLPICCRDTETLQWFPVWSTIMWKQYVRILHSSTVLWVVRDIVQFCRMVNFCHQYPSIYSSIHLSLIQFYIGKRCKDITHRLWCYGSSKVYLH